MIIVMSHVVGSTIVQKLVRDRWIPSSFMDSTTSTTTLLRLPVILFGCGMSLFGIVVSIWVDDFVDRIVTIGNTLGVLFLLGLLQAAAADTDAINSYYNPVENAFIGNDKSYKS